MGAKVRKKGYPLSFRSSIKINRASYFETSAAVGRPAVDSCFAAVARHRDDVELCADAQIAIVSLRLAVIVANFHGDDIVVRPERARPRLPVVQGGV